MPTARHALDGLRVLSIGHTYPGLYCMAILRDLGARIVRIERVGEGTVDPKYEGLGGMISTDSLKAGTSECRLDLKQPKGREVYHLLARKADVILEGFRPDVADRLGIGFKSLARKNKKLIYAAISGYGQQGAWRMRPGHDLNYLADAGVLNLSGDPGGPPATEGVTVADCTAGLNAAINILAAIQLRQRTGKGQFLDLAIVDGPLFLMAAEFEHSWRTGDSRNKGAIHFTGRYPWYGLYETKDGRHLSVGAIEAGFYANLCRLIGRPDLETKRFVSKDELPAVRGEFAKAFKQKTLEEWTRLFEGQDVCISPVLTTAETLASPLGKRIVRPGAPKGVKLVRSPVRAPLAKLQGIRFTSQVLREYGFTAAEVRALQGAGAVGKDS
ncbi:MAG: CoA transferase [Chloroflexi bacterium]|nr:CoA transferase [Chloroflexota bacterium]